MTGPSWKTEVHFEADDESEGLIKRIETRDYVRVDSYEAAEKTANEWNIKRAADPDFEPHRFMLPGALNG